MHYNNTYGCVSIGFLICFGGSNFNSRPRDTRHDTAMQPQGIGEAQASEKCYTLVIGQPPARVDTNVPSSR